MTNMDWMDDDLPQAAGSYLRLKDGDKVRIRIIDGVRGWMHYEDETGKIIEKYTSKANGDKIVKTRKEQKVKGEKLVWLFRVWNYDVNTLQVREITQKGIMQALQELKRDEDHGDVSKYDIKVSRKGSGQNDTEYHVVPGKFEPISEAVMQQVMESDIDLNKSFDADDDDDEIPFNPEQ